MTKRNDCRLNNHQQLQFQGWRANCDIQVVMDHYACVEYLTKYAAKGEPRSPILNKPSILLCRILRVTLTLVKLL